MTAIERELQMRLGPKYDMSSEKTKKTVGSNDSYNKQIFEFKTSDVHSSDLPEGFTIDKYQRSQLSVPERKATVYEFDSILESIIKKENLSKMSREVTSGIIDALSYSQLTVVGMGYDLIDAYDIDSLSETLENCLTQMNKCSPDYVEAYQAWIEATLPDFLHYESGNITYSDIDVPVNAPDIIQVWLEAHTRAYLYFYFPDSGYHHDLEPVTNLTFPEPYYSIDNYYCDDVVNHLLSKETDSASAFDIISNVRPKEYANNIFGERINKVINILQEDITPKSKKINQEIWVRYNQFVKVYDFSGKLLRTERYDEQLHGEF